jgi:MFS family permease
MTDAALDLPPHPAPAARIWGPQLRVLTTGLVSTITLLAFESLAVVTVAPLVSADLQGLDLYGWLTGAFFLTTVVGLVLAGAAMDRAGPIRPFVVGLLVFGAGLAVAATAVDMAVVIVGRGLQGLGDGAIAAVCFGTVGQTYPAQVRPNVFAVLATAWVVPSLGGPAVAAFIAESVGWRWVFGGLIPLVVIAGAITVRALLAATAAGPHVEDGGNGPVEVTVTGAAAPSAGPAAGRAEIWPVPAAGHGPLVRAIRVAAGAGLLLAGLTSRSLVGLPLVAAGLLIGVGALRRLLPAGTLRARPGAPAAVAVRGLLACAFFGADTFVPLAITSVRHASTTVAGLAVTTAAVVWTAGSWTQARLARRRSGRFLVTTGFGTLIIAVAGTGVALLVPAVPLGVGIACWGAAGFGIGIAYSPVMNVALNDAPPDRQGMASSAVSLSDNLGVALGAGIGGVVVAAGTAAGHSASTSGLAGAFALAAAVGLLGLVVARRLPTTALAPPPAEPPPDNQAR